MALFIKLTTPHGLKVRLNMDFVEAYLAKADAVPDGVQTYVHAPSPLDAPNYWEVLETPEEIDMKVHEARVNAAISQAEGLAVHAALHSVPVLHTRR